MTAAVFRRDEHCRWCSKPVVISYPPSLCVAIVGAIKAGNYTQFGYFAIEFATFDPCGCAEFCTTKTKAETFRAVQVLISREHWRSLRQPLSSQTSGEVRCLSATGSAPCESRRICPKVISKNAENPPAPPQPITGERWAQSSGAYAPSPKPYQRN
jgi:hypothetical protein